MKNFFYCCSFLLVCLSACNNDDRQSTSTTSDNAVDAARNFIQAALVGDFERAKIFMVNDSLNHEDLNAIQRLNERLTKEEKEKYQEASIRIHQDRKLNDSTQIIYYSNSFRNKIDSLKVIKAHGEWLVDFKFMFHKTDSLP
jgi:hypothetical protein